MSRLLMLTLSAAVLAACSPRNPIPEAEAPPVEIDGLEICDGLENAWPEGLIDYRGDGVGVGGLVENFALQDHLGEVMCLSQLLEVPVILDFGTVWCGPCHEAGADSEALLEEMHELTPSWIFTVLTENVNGLDATLSDAELWSDLYQSDPTLFPIGADAGKVVHDQFGLGTEYPVFLFIAPGGEIIERIEGLPPESAMLDFIEAYATL
ncbi:MAG: TlpA family protein disulfide reductase [Proteobacteria bacterium]|nr:TlpA family protein disulfide reductase [Pseudomonadota bacterium]